MHCLYPLRGYREAPGPDPYRVRPIVFKAPNDNFLPFAVPCGQCIACRLERSRQWAVRCMHEASLHTDNSFVTLTLDPAHYTPGLDKHLFPAFMKRLRKRVTGKIKYFHCGEYGEREGRPHYHACLFGVDFPNKQFWSSRGGMPLYTSEALTALWGRGRAIIGAVTFDSAAYVARYIIKKVTGPHAQAHYTIVDDDTGELTQLQPEYTTMSRRPGLAAGWALRYLNECYPADSIIVRGHQTRPPRYYDNLYELTDPASLHDVKHQRALKRNHAEETPERLAAHAADLRARLTFKRRDQC